MFSKLKFYIALILIATVCIFTVSAADEIFPDDENGNYTYTVSTEKANTNFTVFAVEGIIGEDEEYDILSGNILYYNVFKSDASGNLTITFIPNTYKDMTLYISTSGSKAKFLCYAMAGEALDIADFFLNPSKTEYTVNGTDSVSMPLNIRAYDSFGYPAQIKNATFNVLDYSGDDILYIPSTGSIQFGPGTKAGTYTAEITCAGITKQVTFTINREGSVGKEIKFTVNGAPLTSSYTDCVHYVSGYTFDPESRVIEAYVLDQYGEETSYPLTFTYSGGSIEAGTVLGTGNRVIFTPPEAVDYGKTTRYDITIVSEEFSLSSKLYIYVEGVTAYTGDSLTLYEAIRSARNYLAQVDEQTILISENGKDIHYTEKWTKADNVTKLDATLVAAVETLEKYDNEEVGYSQLGSAATTLNKAISSFTRSIMKGLSAPIESLSFSESTVKMTIRSSKQFKAVTTPAKPSESVIYTSSDETVATVKPDGTVTAVGEGTAIITASAPDANITPATFEVTVYTPISNIKYGVGIIDIVAGETITPTLNVSPQNHSDTITYKSANTRIASVDETGKIKGISAGTTTITATTGTGNSTSVNVYVTAPTFSATETMRTKPTGTFKLVVNVDSSEGIKELEVKLEFNKDVFSVKNATDLELLKDYAGSGLNENDEYVSTWSISEPHRDISGTLIEYEFETAENAELGKYPIKFYVTALSETDELINANGAELSAEITVGETDTYAVRATVNGEGGTITGDGNFTYGTVVTLTATPESLYTVSTWYVNGKNMGVSTTTYEITVTADTTVTVKFAKKSPNFPSAGPSSPSKDVGGVPDVVVEQVKPVTPGIVSGTTVPYDSVLTLATATPGAMIYYTTDGSSPSAGSILYTSEGIRLTESNVLIKAIAVKGGMIGSIIAEFKYSVDMSTKPAEKPDVIIKQGAASIKYLDGSEPEIRPDDTANRYEIVVMLNNLFDILGVSDATLTLTDVEDAYKEIIRKFVGAGVISGYPEGTFGGERGITRAELVKILSVMLKVDMSDMSIYDASFSDTAGHWAENYIKAFVTKGYIVGYPEGDFRPDNPVTRAEAVTVFNRITGIITRTNLAPVFSDLSEEHWAYDSIMNIVNTPTPVEIKKGK